MARLSAKKLAQDLLRSGWRPGRDIRKSQAFAELAEECGTTTECVGVLGADRKIGIGEGQDYFELRDLAENLIMTRDGEPIGPQGVNDLFFPGRPSMYTLQEAGDVAGISTSAFMATTGQLLVTKVLDAYEEELGVVRNLFDTYQSPLPQEKWIGTAPPRDLASNQLKVAENEEFPYAAFGDQYVQTPMTQKWGEIIALTKEAIFFNLTGDLTQKAQMVGEALGHAEEIECIQCLIGRSTRFTEKRQGDAGPLTMDIYQRASAASGAYQLSYTYSTREYNFVNDVPDNALDDYTAVQTADQYFSHVLDPNRGRPLSLGKDVSLLAPYGKRIDLTRVLWSENVFNLTQQGITTVGALVTQAKNPLSEVQLTRDRIAVSRLLHTELKDWLSITDAQTYELWFYGNFRKAFCYVQNWPMAMVQAPPNNPDEFHRDVVMQWKASKRGVAAVKEPRYIQRHNLYRGGSTVG